MAKGKRISGLTLKWFGAVWLASLGVLIVASQLGTLFFGGGFAAWREIWEPSNLLNWLLILTVALPGLATYSWGKKLLGETS